MKTSLAAIIQLHAGGGWAGHTFFLVIHPISKDVIARTNSIESVEAACSENNLVFDSSIKEIIDTKLEKTDHGYVVPKEFLDEKAIISSASKYLKKIQEDYF